jgi:hypothetical protein
MQLLKVAAAVDAVQVTILEEGGHCGVFMRYPSLGASVREWAEAARGAATTTTSAAAAADGEVGEGDESAGGRVGRRSSRSPSPRPSALRAKR